MFISRKGLSDIVTNVLIILLVLVAVGIIWAFVRPTINQGAGQLEGQSDCLAIQVEPVTCKLVSGTGATAKYTVNFKRTTGGSDDGIKGLKYIFSDGTNTKVIDSTLAAFPKQLESSSEANLGPGFTATKVDTAVVIQTSNGPKTCQERGVSITCA